MVAYGGVPAPVSHCGRFAARWRKIFAGETKTGVNRVQDSAVAIRRGGGAVLVFLGFLAGVFCDVKCFTHVECSQEEMKAKKGEDLTTLAKMWNEIEQNMFTARGQGISDSHIGKMKYYNNTNKSDVPSS